jgi:uncharacterized protein YlxW (UPF0749 family)
MSLLVDIARQALDPGYADAAARRGPDPERRPLLAVAGVLAATLVIVVAGVQAHRHAPQLVRSRQALVDQVGERTDGVASLQRRLDALRSRTAALRDRALASSRAGSTLAARLATEELLAGTVAAVGPGLRVVLDDAPSAGPGNRVLDRDLQAVVNALWSAGAEAVAVGDQRLTTETAIRQAGSAVLVNFQAVSPPYVVRAIGDPVPMETSFAASRAAGRMRTLAQLYGLRFRYTREASLAVPPAPGLTLRYAAVAPAAEKGSGP